MTGTAGPRHTEATSRAILEAAVDLFLERQGDGFSVQEVADRAGLTHRTVYRYFPSRQELLGAAAQRLAPDVAEDPFTEASTVREWIDTVGGHFARTEANLEIVRKVVAAMLAADDMRLGQDIRARDAHRWEVFRRQFPDLPDGDARRTFATLRHLMSSTSYVLYRLRFGLSPAEATEAIRGAASQIVERAARRDRAAKQGRKR
jgi:AcrR family transcriptional regulator